MANINCPVHGFDHLSSKNSTISSVQINYDNVLMKVNIKEVIRYCRLRSYVITNVYTYAFEMNEECPDGYNTENNAIFTCDNRRGVLVNQLPCCLFLGKHDLLEVLADKTVDEDSVCCIYTLAKLVSIPSLIIGGKCILQRSPFRNYFGACKWIGKINETECVGVEMINWISNDCNGYCMGIKIFDCREGHGILLRSVDVKMENVEQRILNQYGFIDLRNIYLAKKQEFKTKRMLKIGRRVDIVYPLNKGFEVDNKSIFGVIRWIGTINDGICFGIELDYRCDGAMDGVISCSESFDCEPDHGVVCPINSVTFDYYIYSVEFTVDEAFNLDSKIIHKEDWHQESLQVKDLRLNSNAFVFIEKENRILDSKGQLKWCGFINGVSVAILEMDANFPITPQQKIINILKDLKEVAYLIVNIQNLFKYKTMKAYKKTEYDIVGFDIGKTTEFGDVLWRGIDGDDNLYYGFEMDSESEGGTDGTFNGQVLFECVDGLGVLISARKILEGLSSTKSISADTASCSSAFTSEDMVTLLTTITNIHGISSDELLSTAMTLENKSIIAPLLANIASSINIYKNPEIVNQLLESQSFDTLEKLVNKCPVDADNNEQLLRVAAECLKYGKLDLCEEHLNKCTNKDMLMDNGETFITHIIKENIDQSLIIKIIEGYEFDINKANKDNCIPLALACTNTMMDVVDCIVRYIKNQDIGKKMCSICMDRNISTVFNCGHNSCKECSENISVCHICKNSITTRGVLYLC